MAPRTIVKHDCYNCVNSNGYGWDCDRNPKVFEPEVEVVKTGENTSRHDFSGVPDDREIYCREFIPIAWRKRTYDGKVWYREDTRKLVCSNSACADPKCPHRREHEWNGSCPSSCVNASVCIPIDV